jgi:hypothetical protein
MLSPTILRTRRQFEDDNVSYEPDRTPISHLTERNIESQIDLMNCSFFDDELNSTQVTS